MSPHSNNPDSEPTNLWSFSLMLHTKQRSNKYQFHSLWFDPIGTPQSTTLEVKTLTINYTMDVVSPVKL